MLGEIDALASKASDAAARSDSGAIASLLDSHNSTCHPSSLDDLLLQSSAASRLLHGVLFTSEDRPCHSSNNGDERTAASWGRDRLMRALLLVAPVYETPWLAAYDFVSCTAQQSTTLASRRQSPSSLRSSVADIQSFLQQTVVSWWGKERRGTIATMNTSQRNSEKCTRHNPRHWILKITKRIVFPLTAAEQRDNFSGRVQTSRCNNRLVEEGWMVPLEILSTIIAMSNDLDSHLHEAAMDIIFQQQDMRPDRLLPWLTLATEVHSFLRDQDRAALLSTLQRRDQANNKPWIAFSLRQDLPGLLTAIVSLSSALWNDNRRNQNRSAQTYSKIEFQSWRNVALQALVVASRDSSTFSTVSTVLQSNFALLPKVTLDQWIMHDSDDLSLTLSTQQRAHGGDNKENNNQEVPRWAHANMILAILRAVRSSGSQLVSNLVARALGSRVGSSDLVLEGWMGLVRIAFPPFNSCGVLWKPSLPRRACSSSASPVDQFLVEGVSYAGKGRFTSKCESTTIFLTQIGALVYESLFLGQDESSQRFKVYVAEQAQGWVYSVQYRLSSSQRMSAAELAFVVVILVIVFCEVPLSRLSVVRNVLQTIAGDADYVHSRTEMALLHCVVLSAIAKSRDGDKNSKIDELNSVVDLIAGNPMPKRVFLSLIDAVADSSSAAQEAILAAARKRVQAPQVNIWWDGQNSFEDCERIKCGLHALCTLIASPRWSLCSFEAWKLLSDVIVLNRPLLPVPTRSWLFQRLRELVETHRYSFATVQHLFRACLVRTFQFFDSNAPTDKLGFNPHLTFTVWKDADSGGNVKITPVEDIPGLYQLLITLLLHSLEHDQEPAAAKLIEKGRGLFLHWCLSGESESVESGSKLDMPDQESSLLNVYAAVCSVMRIVDFVWTRSADDHDSTSCYDHVVADPGADHLESSLITQERLRVENFITVNGNCERFMPDWLQASTNSCDRTIRQHLPLSALLDAVASLRYSLCSAVAALMQDHRWSFAGINVEGKSSVEANRKFLLGMQCLTDCKQRLAVHQQPAGQVQLDCCFKGNDKAMCACLTAASIVLENSLKNGRRRVETTAILSLVFDQLGAIIRCFNDKDTGKLLDMDLSALIRCVWRLYQTIGSETASAKFIVYLEDQGENALELCSDDAECAAHVDETVRHTRAKLIEAFRCCVVQYSTSNSQSANARIKVWPPTTSSFLEVYYTRHLESYVVYIKSLSSDLRVGLDGRSGGVTMSMFSCFVDSIVELSEFVQFGILGTNNLNTLQFVMSGCRESAALLRDAISAYPVKSQSLFKKAFSVASKSLPSVARSALRQLSYADSTLDTRPQYQEHDDFASESFCQCLELLTGIYGHGADKPSWSTWEDVEIPIPIPSHGDEGKQCRHKQSANGSVVGAIPSVVTISIEENPFSRGGESSTSGNGGMIPISSKETWKRLCSGAILALEENIEESQQIMRQHNNDGISNLDSTLSAIEASYLSFRKQELQRLLENVNRALCPPNDAKGRSAARDSSGTTSWPNPAAVIMPSSAKMRLCSYLDRTSSALYHALKLLGSYAKQKTSLQSRLALLEAVALVSAWCCGPKGCDLIVGARLWYAAETKGASLQSCQNHGDAADVGIIRSVSKLMPRIEKLESAVHRLHNILSASNNDASKSGRTQRLEECFSKTRVHCDIDENCMNGNTGMLKMIADKVQLLQENQSKFRNCEGHCTIAGEIKSRKRRKITTKLRGRVLRRSRNHTVDEWLRVDQRVGIDENFADDAYADLEDFLVDG